MIKFKFLKEIDDTIVMLIEVGRGLPFWLQILLLFFFMYLCWLLLGTFQLKRKEMNE